MYIFTSHNHGKSACIISLPVFHEHFVCVYENEGLFLSLVARGEQGGSLNYH